MILKYNQIAVFKNIDLLKEKGYIDSNIAKDIIEQYRNTCLYPLVALIDRTNTLGSFLPLSYNDKMPDYNPTFNLTFSQVCELRSKELLNTGKKLNVFWSGGLDSTVVLLSLINNAKHLDQIRVIATHTSIVESGPIFDNHIKNRVDILLNSSTTREYFYSTNNFDVNNELFITGDCADQLIVQSFQIPINKDDYFLPWQEVVESGRSSIDSTKIEFVKPCLEKSPRPLVTYRDLLWYYRFNFQWVQSRYSQYMGLDPKYHPVVFFNAPEFQQWSIQDKEEMEEPLTHKYSYRKFIYEQTRNKEYSFEKPKTASSPWINYTTSNDIFLMSDGTTKTINSIYNEESK